MEVVEAIHDQMLTDVGDGEFTVTYPVGRGVPNGPIPFGGDYGVLSCNPPNGKFWLMPPGTAGDYERCMKNGNALAYRPPYNGPVLAYLIPYAPDCP